MLHFYWCKIEGLRRKTYWGFSVSLKSQPSPLNLPMDHCKSNFLFITPLVNIAGIYNRIRATVEYMCLLDHITQPKIVSHKLSDE